MNKEAVIKGQAIYSRAVLSIYDIWVLGLSNRFIWQCKTDLIGEHFSNLTSNNHLDIGVGTGYYLKKYLPSDIQRIGLLDLNQNSLEFASKAIHNLKPEIYHRDIFEPVDIEINKFDSVSINYLLHCLPGNFLTKSVVLKNIKDILNYDGVIFGSTILGKNSKTNATANFLLKKYNQSAIFSNLEDDFESLEFTLNQHFSEVKIKMIGCVALFSARNKSTEYTQSTSCN